MGSGGVTATVAGPAKVNVMGSGDVTLTGGAWNLGANNSFTGPPLAEGNATLITNTLTMRGAPGPFGASKARLSLEVTFNVSPGPILDVPCDETFVCVLQKSFGGSDPPVPLKVNVWP